MTICTQCRQEMLCTKTGRYVRFGGGHCYSGDEYACPKCGATIVVCGNAPFHDTKSQALEMGEARK